MAVYTDISGADFQALLLDFDIGDFVSAQGIAEGVENSNYLLLTTKGPFIATAYEKRMDASELPFFLNLMTHLADGGISCPQPIPDKAGSVLRTVNDRPFTMVSFLEGAWPRRPKQEQCRAVGKALADIHVAADSYSGARENTMGVAYFKEQFSAIASRLDQIEQGLSEEISGYIDRIITEWPDDLPQGIIHADCFPDNVLFKENDVTGVIDFYFACNDYLAYDVAITLNAWCFEAYHEFNMTKASQLLKGYQSVKKLSASELEQLPLLALAAAMRFFLSRAIDYLDTPEGALVKVKDPMEYVEKLRFHAGVTSYTEYGA